MTHTLTIPGWHPRTVNQLLTPHLGTRARLKEADRQMVGGYALALRIPRAACKRRVSLRVSGWARGGRRVDPDAYWKSVLDALVAADLLRDDGARWCELGQVQVVKGEDSTTVILEDLPS